MSNFDALFGESEFDLRDLSPANNSDTMSIHGLLDAQKKSVSKEATAVATTVDSRVRHLSHGLSRDGYGRDGRRGDHGCVGSLASRHVGALPAGIASQKKEQDRVRLSGNFSTATAAARAR